MAYVPPVQNPLRRSLGRYRGLGDIQCAPGTGNDAVACVPFIGTSATVDVTPAGATVTGQGASSGYSSTSGPPLGSPADWLNANASVLVWIGGIAFVLMFLSKLGK